MKLWEIIDSDEPDVSELHSAVVTFTKQFRKSFASHEVPNYIHMLCHVPLLIERFGTLKVFQQQRVEALNHALNMRVRSVTRPGPTQMLQAVQAMNRRLSLR